MSDPTIVETQILSILNTTLYCTPHLFGHGAPGHGTRLTPRFQPLGKHEYTITCVLQGFQPTAPLYVGLNRRHVALFEEPLLSQLCWYGFETFFSCGCYEIRTNTSDGFTVRFAYGSLWHLAHKYM